MIKNRYIYISKEEAKKGVSLVYTVSDERIKNMDEYFEGRACLFIGEDLPHFITYIEETNSVREATEEEKLARNQRILNENEFLDNNGKIKSYDINTQKIINNEIIDKTREDLIKENKITLDLEKNKARMERDKQLKALDLYDKAVLRGDIEETKEMKEQRDIFRKKWLELPNIYKDILIPVESLYPEQPHIIVYFDTELLF